MAKINASWKLRNVVAVASNIVVLRLIRFLFKRNIFTSVVGFTFIHIRLRRSLSLILLVFLFLAWNSLFFGVNDCFLDI